MATEESKPSGANSTPSSKQEGKSVAPNPSAATTSAAAVPAPTSAPAAAAAAAAAPALAPAADENAPKLTPAQLKAKAKAEKAARRTAVKDARAAAPVPAPAPPAGQAGGSQAGGQSQSQSQPQSQSQSQLRPGVPPRRPSAVGRRPSIAPVEKDVRSTIPEPFSHLPMAKRIHTSQAHKEVHPSVLVVGQQMATFALRDTMARLEATLLAFRQVIESYTTPKGNSLSRHFLPHVLNPQIEYLTECRPMCFAMGNAIRLLKARVNHFDIDTPEDEAKEALLDLIDSFISERITLAELVITRNAVKTIMDGDVILTYGRHRLVEMTIRQAREAGKQFELLIVDDPYDPTGQQMAKLLRQTGIRASYMPHLGGLRLAMKKATSVLLGAEAFFANGAMYGRSGTSEVCIAAHDASVPVLVLCETINFDKERVALDSLTYNEIDPDRNSAEATRLLFDTTRDRYITGIITENESETAVSPSKAILSILSRQERPTMS